MDEKNSKKEEMRKKRELTLEKFYKQTKLVGENVIYPTYRFNDELKIYIEDEQPPEELFIRVGYDPKHDSKQMHYRRFYEDELENVPSVMPPSPFETFKIMRGQSRGLSKSWFWKNDYDEAGQVTNLKEVGRFKGMITVVNKNKENEYISLKGDRIGTIKDSLNEVSRRLYNKPFDYDFNSISSSEGKAVFRAKLKEVGCEDLEIEKYFTQVNYQEELARLLMVKTKCIIRAYILDVDELPPKDSGGS